MVVSVRRPGPAAGDRPPADARGRRAARAPASCAVPRRTFRALRSLRAENVLASAPGRSVTTTYFVQAPDRLAIDVHGGEHARIIGTNRWDLQAKRHLEALGDVRRCTSPTRSGRRPRRPCTCPGTAAASSSSRSCSPAARRSSASGSTAEAHVVVRLRMITTAHFMSERELDLNHAPPVVPPT